MLTGLLVGTAFLPLLAAPAGAYMEPGTGSLLLQLLLGGGAGLTVAFRMYGKRTRAFLAERWSRFVGGDRGTGLV